MALIESLTFGPQVRLVWQRFSFDDNADSFSTVSFDEGRFASARID
jgi:type V secretory pathway adhesin AidA